MGIETGLLWLRSGKVAGARECVNEFSVSIEFGEFRH